MTQTKEKEAGALDETQSKLMQGKGFSFSGYERDSLRWHQPDGTLVDISGVSGVDSITDGRGAVFADFDNDGDLDIFLTTIQGDGHLLFRNNVGSRGGGFVRVAVEGTKSGRDAFGAVVRVKTSLGIETKLKAGGMGFLSQHDPRLLFGLGKASDSQSTGLREVKSLPGVESPKLFDGQRPSARSAILEDEEAEWVEVTWPGGAKSRLDRVKAGTSLLFIEGQESPTKVKEPKGSLPDPATARERLLASLHLEIGKPLPAMKLTTLDGESGEIPSGRALVNIWATWCTACAREMPELEKLAPRLSKRGIALLGLNIDAPADAAKIARYLSLHGITYPILVGGGKAIEALYQGDEVSAPISILLDSQGRVESVQGGFGTAARSWLETLVSDDP